MIKKNAALFTSDDIYTIMDVFEVTHVEGGDFGGSPQVQGDRIALMFFVQFHSKMNDKKRIQLFLKRFPEVAEFAVSVSTFVKTYT